MEVAITRSSGKVLIAGGYGVLQNNNYGLTLALDSSFYCVCTLYEKQHEGTNVCIRSKQISGQWEYVQKNGQIFQVQGKKNPFVENAVRWTLQFCDKKQNAGKICLEIVFDRNFISDRDAQDNSKYPVYQKGYAKTGLGSSACVLVSIVKCLIKILKPQLSQNKKEESKIVNVISQMANLYAQGKIGSNFDISTAVFGTHLYKNVLPYRIEPILNLSSNMKKQMLQLLKVDPEIQTIQNDCSNLSAYIIDINKGADTRVMVKGFISQLHSFEKDIKQKFYRVSKQVTLDLFTALNQKNYKKCKQINKKHRELQRQYSDLTNIPIEPKDLTPLIDKIIENQNILYAICPGSGGHDAVFVLAEKNEKEYIQKIAHEHNVREVKILPQNSDEVSEKIINDIMNTIKNI